MRYSLRWNCPIKLVWMQEGQMKSGNITVVNITEDDFSFTTARSKKTPQTLEFADILAAGYARGDDGDTSKKRQETP